MSISKSSSISLLLLGLLLLLPCTHAQEVPAAAAAAAAPRAAAGLDCSEALLNLSACLTYVVQGSNLTRPEKGCCPALAGLINSEPICLCQLIASYGSGSGLGVQVDATRVLTLPTICRVDAPPTSICAVLGVPVASVSPTSGGPEEAGSGPPTATPENTNGSGFSSCGAAVLPRLFILSFTAMFLTIYS